MTAGPAPLRAVRAAAFAAAALVLAVSAHRAGGGSVPDLATLSVGALGFASVAWLLAGRQRSLGAIAAAVLASQAALHAAFAGAAHDPGAILHCVSHDGTGQVSAPAMLACHAVAALALALLLERGETWACGVAAAVVHGARLLRRGAPAIVLVGALLPPRAHRLGSDHLAGAAWLRPLACGRSTCGPPCAT